MNEIIEYQNILMKYDDIFSTKENYFNYKNKRVFYPKIIRLSQEIDESINNKDINKLFSLYFNKPKFTFKKELETLIDKSKHILEINKIETPELYQNEVKEYSRLYKNLIELQKQDNTGNIYDFYSVLPRIIYNTGNNTVNDKGNDKGSGQDFRFKTVDECKTNKRSAKYYYSKNDLIEMIKSNKSLLEKFPKNYKSLSKDEICKNIFK